MAFMTSKQKILGSKDIDNTEIGDSLIKWRLPFKSTEPPALLYSWNPKDPRPLKIAALAIHFT